MSEQQKIIRKITGRVVSNKGDKTITVLVERKVKHPLYKKYIKRSSKIYAHDEDNQCNIGDVVAVSECRPRSKTKNWQLVNIITVAEQIEAGQP